MCGTFKNFTHESNLWISNGGTRSVIHYDADHNLHCMIAGRKDFMMIENKYSEDLYFGPKVRQGISFLKHAFIGCTDLVKRNYKNYTGI